MNVLIATPVDGTRQTGSVTAAYHEGVSALRAMLPDVHAMPLLFNDDIVRARSRAAKFALDRRGWDAILWIDADVVFTPEVAVRMIQRATADGHDVIGAPYPRKRIPAAFPYKPLDDALADGRMCVTNDCIEVELLAFGFMLTTRKCLAAMVDRYRDSDWYSAPTPDGGVEDIVAIFGQRHSPARVVAGRPVRDLYSEDYSFCSRWREMGGRVQMYVGLGAPLGHVGGFVYTGRREELGNAR